MVVVPHCSTDSELLAALSRDTVYSGHPEFACRAADVKVAGEVLEYCHAHKIPVTFCGSQTSLTGASVADQGVALALGRMDRILEIARDTKLGEGFIITEPGVILGDLKRAVAKEGWFYPPDPTSFEEAQMGATVATNATGEETFRFGPTRFYVQEMDVLTANGSACHLVRTAPPPRAPFKNTAGYFLGGEEIDHFIGSEGTLGLITRLKLRLLPDDGQRFVLILPFRDFANCVAAAVKIAEDPHGARGLELIGPGAAEYFQACPECPGELKGERCFLYLKDAYRDEAEYQHLITKWYERLTDLYHASGERDTIDRVFAATTPAQLTAIKTCRHFIPLKVNEEYFPYQSQGGGKVGTDWWVPIHHLEEMMMTSYTEARSLGIPFLVFAHIGNGHPHWNFLTQNAAEQAKARDFVKRQCRQAVLLGGGVAGEHGLGKIRRDMLTVQHAPKMICRMIDLKRRWDPEWLLGRGNILKPC